MSRPRTTEKATARKRPTGSDVVTLTYDLAELPSTQHRAGLAGLVMMLRWLDAQPDLERKGTCSLEDVSPRGASIRFDGPGLQWLFDWLYASDEEEREESQPRKKKNKEIEPPLREAVKEEVGKDGKRKQKKVYVYPVVVPKGAMLLALDPTRQGNKGLWIKLWRDFVWGILRGVPAQREPFEARAEKRVIRDGEELHLALAEAPEAPVPLPSTYYLGAQAKTAEGVLFQDRARFQLLLHFWPYVAQIYVPRVIDLNDGKMRFDGYSVAIPDVANLDQLAAELVAYLASRSSDVLTYLPRGAVIDLPVEAALDTAVRLRRQMSARGSRFEGLVAAYDIYHVRKDGNNVRVLYSGRVDPVDIVDEYEAIRSSYVDALFVRRRISNLVEDQRLRRLRGAAADLPAVRWYSGFDRDAATVPHDKAFFGSRFFRRDARQAFILAARSSGDAGTEETLESGDKKPTTIEELVYRLVREYVHRRVKSKYGLDPNTVKENPSKQKDYNEAKEKVARDAFLAVRSRSDADFAEYFAGTIGSVPHWIQEQDFVQLTRCLRDDKLRADVRTLTLLALSAAAWTPSNDKRNDPKGEDS